MSHRIIIKFRSNLWINSSLPYINNYSLPKDYFHEADTYHINAYSRNFKYNWAYFIPARFKSTLPLPLFDKNDENILYDQWRKLQEYLILNKGLFPAFLFRYNRIKTTNEFWQYPDYSFIGGWFDRSDLRPVPNLYNYFEIKLPNTYSTKDALALLDSLRTYLPNSYEDPASGANGYGITHKEEAQVQQPKPHLLEYAYLQTTPTVEFMPYPTLPVFPINNGGYMSNSVRYPPPGNQNYLKDMNFNLTPDDKAGQGVGISIIENDTWATNHPEFEWKDGRRTRIFPIPASEAYDISQDPWLTSAGTDKFLLGNPLHGTHILGILKSKFDGPASDLYSCSGIVPNATYRFASAQVDINRAERYPEGAVLESLSKSSSGDVILIEMGTPDQKLPLEVYPPVYELLQLAFRRNVIVIEAAGNGTITLDNSRPTVQEGLRVDMNTLIEQTNDGAYFKKDRFWWSQHKNLNKRIKELFNQEGLPASYSNISDFVSHYVNNETEAILIGSATRNINKDGRDGFTILTNSSRGRRVRVFAQGEKILTTTYKKQGLYWKFDYTGVGETSGAAAIIAGFVVALQGIARQKGYIITPTEMKELLNQGISVGGEAASGACIPNFKVACLRLKELIGRSRNPSAT